MWQKIKSFDRINIIMVREKVCPKCKEEYPWESAKEKRRYVRHLEEHITEMMED